MARARRSQVALSSGAWAMIWPSSTHAVADVVLLEGGVGLAPQLRQRLGDRAGVVLDLGFELDRGFVELARWKALSAADAGMELRAMDARVTSAATRPTRNCANMGLVPPPPSGGKFPRGRPSKHNPESCPVVTRS